MSISKGVIEPRCPFCSQRLPRPRQVEPKRLGDFDFGVCECGAVFAHDVTGHNLGAAMVEALGFACDDDWDLAWSLMPGEDYNDALIEGYDFHRHVVFPKGYDQEGNKVRGALSFIRLNDDLQGVKHDGARTRFQEGSERPLQPTATENISPAKGGKRRRYSKREVERLVKEKDLQRLVDMALEDKLVLRKIQRLLYAADFDTRWQAVLVLGQVAAALARHDPSTVGDLLRRLLYSANDSAATNWGAIETVGEIIRNQPSVYGSFVRHILGLVGDVPSRPAILWAIGRIGELHPKLVRNNSFFVMFDLLDAEEPEVRGHAAWALGRIKAREAEKALERLVDDDAEFTLFDGESLKTTTVGKIAKEALDSMKDSENKAAENGVEQKAPLDARREPPEIIAARQAYQEADILKNRGQSLDALAKFEEVLSIFDNAGYEVEVANICEKIGDLHVMRGNMKAALSPYQRTLAICEKKNDPISTVIMLEKVIDIYRHLKEYDKTLPYYFRALELVEKLSDVKRSALFLAGIADVYERQGKIDEALDAYRLAERLFRGMGAREKADLLKEGIEALEAQQKKG
ncbi:MAG: tetratricopeptide repeat protein [Thermodesulfobacteria bacterium]|nr:tetratricopeptide repeat protein [Thermodesulfobacteriota bacterium]